jgi:hypothetical protein
MAIQQGQTTSFKQQILLGQHDLTTDVLKIALYNAPATLGPLTTVYTSSYEVVTSGYTAGGLVLVNVTVAASNGVAYVSFNNPSWNAAITARGALIYNSSKSNKSIAVLDFGSDKTSANTFTITLPANTYSSAVIRIT